MSALKLSPPERGALFVISGPSGVGKSTLLQALFDQVPHLAFSVSATTRPPREGEEDGIHYDFMDEDSFRRLVEEGAFLEWATVYDRLYGTPASRVEALRARGESVVLDVDARGSEQIRESAPEAVHIFILPPDLETLEARLRGRGTEDEAVVARRMALAKEQLQAAPTYDHLIVNDDLDTATAELVGAVLETLGRA